MYITNILGLLGMISSLCFKVPCFGVASASYIFIKLLQPLIRYWRGKGLRTVVYLDDGLRRVAIYSSAVEPSLLVRNTLECAGFIVHPAKVNWEPTQRLVWLGFVIDLCLGQIEVPPEMIASSQDALTQTRPARYSQARRLASIIGQIISMGLAIGPVSRFMIRSLYALSESRLAWCDQLMISPEARDEMDFLGTKPNRVQIIPNLALSLASEGGLQ